MIDWLLEKVVKNRFLILIFLIVLAVWGGYSYYSIPIDAFPEVTNQQVQILTKVPGMSPVEVEQLVTHPVELSMASLPNVTERRSISQFGLSAITIVFEDQVDLYFARQLISQRLNEVKGDLPDEAETEMGPMSTGLGLIYEFLVKDDTTDARTYSPMELRTILDWDVVPELRGVSGVVEVNAQGGFVKQYQAVIDQDALQNYDVSLDQVYNAIANSNGNTGGQYIERQDKQLIVRGIGRLGATNSVISDLKNTVITSRGGTPITLRTIADVIVGHATRYGAAVANGKGEVVNGTIMMRKGADARKVLDRVKKKMETIKSALPAGVKIEPYYDRINLVQKAIGTVTSSLLIGGFLVIFILTLFIGDWRSALIVSLVLPFTALFTFILMNIFGFGANLMSLGGLAIGIGMFVDGAIVMVENVYRLRQEEPELPLKRVVIRAGKEVGRPIAFAIGVVITVFLPLFTLQGFEGRMFRPLAFTISFALFAALLLALILAPALSSYLIRTSPQQDDSSPLEEGNAIVRFCKRLYNPALNWAVQHRVATTSLAVLCIAGSVLIFRSIGSEFVPQLEEGSISLEVARDPSISLDASVKIESKVQRIVKQFPEVTNIVSKVGRAVVATDPNPQSLSDVYVGLKPMDQWRYENKEALISAMRDSLEQIPGIAVSFSQPIQQRVDELISGVKSQVAVKIFGPDLNKLKNLGDQFASVLQDIPGAVGVKTSKVSGLGYLQITVDRKKAARYGISVSQVQRIIESAIGGARVTTVKQGERRFNVLLRYEKQDRDTPHAIRAIPVHTPGGQKIRLGDISTVKIVEGPAEVRRENGKREMIVQLNVTGRDLVGFVNQAKQAIQQKVPLPAGYYTSWGGQFESQQRASKRLSIIIPITLLIIFLILYITFSSIRQATLVLLNIPFSIVGGILLLWVLGEYMSVPASVGFIAVMGMAVQNGVVMITFINDLREQGRDIGKAVLDGAMLRLRPILMTSATTLLGLIPLLVATGIGSDVQRPLAAVVVGGIFTSLASTLLLLPALYKWFAVSEN